LAGFIILFIAMVATVSFNSSSLVNFGTPGLVGLIVQSLIFCLGLAILLENENIFLFQVHIH
jgi:hypothetical protein